MAKNPLDQSMAAGHQRVAHIDGHGVNHSYKNPSASGKENLSYMHPGKPLSFDTAFKTADKALAESHRPLDQMGRSKTVFPVSTEKQRGQPPRPPFAKASRAASHSPKVGQPGVPTGPAKPVMF